ncbi:MAG: hypothetical protein H5U40_10015 [Polyangiaceae bacterium]|nr:hypothetical protein [Polyangiaceae bacterium]
MQIRAHLASVDERRGELTRAVESGDTQAQAHQYTTLRVLAQKLRENERDAAQCLGQGVFEVPEATASGDGPMEVVDPTVLPAMPAPEVPFIPPPASGTF